MNRFVSNKFTDQYKATRYADLLAKEVMIGDTLVTMQVADSWGKGLGFV